MYVCDIEGKWACGDELHGECKVKVEEVEGEAEGEAAAVAEAEAVEERTEALWPLCRC